MNGTMVDTLPLVSIITPAYNRASSLDETIQSVLQQDYPRIEYIVLDDGSTDSTRDVLAEFTGPVIGETCSRSTRISSCTWKLMTCTPPTARAGLSSFVPRVAEGFPMNKVFVTGVYGSGKTYFARRYAAKRGIDYLSFDKLHDYGRQDNQSKDILDNLPAFFVMDAIPFDGNGSWADFAGYEAVNDVLVVCVYCPNEDEWLRRLRDKARSRRENRLLRTGRRFLRLARKLSVKVRNKEVTIGDVVTWIKRSYCNARKPKVIIDNIKVEEHLHHRRAFFISHVPFLREFTHVVFFDALNNEFTSQETMLRRILYKYFPLRDRLFAEDYDVGYQDIEILDSVGYSKSHQTWENIKGLVDWEGKEVIDLGCFHGYFAFKVEDCGGIAQGFDSRSDVLVTTRMIEDLRGGNVVFKQWVGGDDIPACDVSLCLNVLHHFGDRDIQEKAVSKMNCRTAIFEINRDQRTIVEKYFRDTTEVVSHRENRIILLCTKPKLW